MQYGNFNKRVYIEQTENCLGVIRLDDDDNGVDIQLTKSLLDPLDAGYCIT